MVKISESSKKTIVFLGIELVIGTFVGFFTGEYIMGLITTAIVGNIIIIYVMESKLGYIKINDLCEKLGLTTNMLADEKLGDNIQKLNKNISEYCDYRQKLDDKFKVFGDDTIKKTAESFEHLSEHQLTITYQDIREFGENIMDQAEKDDELWATSAIYSPIWWQGKAGYDYIMKKRDVAKIANVKQIFITEDKTSLKNDEDTIKKLVKSNNNSNVPEVYAINVKYVDPKKIRDFLILKGKIAFELIFDKYTIRGFNIYFNNSQKYQDLEKNFIFLLNDRKSNLIKYDSAEHSDFDRFIDEVFK